MFRLHCHGKNEELRMRMCGEAVTRPYFAGKLTPHEWPVYSNDEPAWWTCLVWQRLQNMKIALARAPDIKAPNHVEGLPVEDEGGSSTSDQDLSSVCFRL